MINFGEVFDAAIKDTVNDVLIKGEIPDIVLSETDNLGEVVEKLCILHIRTWMLEDAAQEATSDEELGVLKRKIDICFKQKRPRLVQAINRQVSDAIVNNTSLVEDSVKLYRGAMSVFDFVQRHIDAIKHSMRNVESEKYIVFISSLRI